ncbi:MAG: GPP34 family phosphoprotein [Propionibacteriales bacterium]|nr:GPP34 family phosphoprotein [Propionibacteriales bacterium]
MGVAADLTLVALDPATGKSLLGSTESEPVTGGAALVDLVLAERCTVEGEGRKARVRLVDATPLGDVALDHALSRIKPGRDHKASSLVPRIGKGTRALVLDQLVAEGALAARREKVLGLVPVVRHDVVGSGRRDLLVAGVVAVLLGQAEPNDATGPLIGLLWAGNVIKRIVTGPERPAARKRAKVISRGEWAGTASQAAIAATNAAVTAAVTAAVVAASAGGAGA